jgi:hypothetical protein
MDPEVREHRAGHGGVLLSGKGGAPLRAAKYKWTPKPKPATATGPLSLTLSETPHVSFSGEVTAGSFSPLALGGTASQTYEGGAKCGVPEEGKKTAKAVKKGTFTGSQVVFN